MNIPADATLAELAEMRAAVSLPLDLYVEAPDPLGGVVRGQELGDLIKAGAPLYAKFGLRNAQAVYPSGHHLEAVACANAIEKVHRAAVALEWLERLSPGLVQSKPGAAGLASRSRHEPRGGSRGEAGPGPRLAGRQRLRRGPVQHAAQRGLGDGGLEDRVVRNEEPALVWALVTPLAACVPDHDQHRAAADSGRGGPQGFSSCTRCPWYSPRGLAEVVDEPGRRATRPAEAPASLRMPLLTEEAERLSGSRRRYRARPGRGDARPGSPSSGSATWPARIAAALEERLIFPSVLLVGGAARRRAFRHPVPTPGRVTGRDVLAVVVGVRGGLNVACSRSVSAGARRIPSWRPGTRRPARWRRP